MDSDADVLLFNKDTYIVSRFKELITENFRHKFCTKLDNTNVTISKTFGNISINEVYFQAKDIIWQSSSVGIMCKLLKVGSINWQAGRLRIKVSTEIISPYLQKDSLHSVSMKFTTGELNITVVLEFYPDNPSEPESPLDDIRKMIQAT
ncbi:hypothetical protein KBT16_30050 [Nostoc sp. CCCryo 231-06]|nr:hypothetical protein [Nostoc sp. CCCryo 231-06]